MPTNYELRDIPGWEGLYQASNYGFIFSIKYGKYKALRLNSQTGYLQTDLFKGGVRKYYRVHTLIALTFLGPCPEGCQVMHGPCGKTINSIWNLAYGTPSQNMQDWWDNGKTWRALTAGRDLSKGAEMDDEELALPPGFSEDDFDVFDDPENFDDEETNWEGDDWEDEDD